MAFLLSVRPASIALLALTVTGTLNSPRIAFAQRLRFEVASAKHTPNEGPFGSDPQRSGDRFSMHHAQLTTIIWYAYHLRGSYQLVGDLGYGSDEWNSFNIDARVGQDATDDQVRLMVQSLLEDRFHLKLHREKRELTGYELSVDKNGPRLTAASEQPMNLTIEGRHFSQPKATCMTTLWNDGAHLTCHGATLEQVVSQLGVELKSPITDHTGLTATYDVHLVYMPGDRRNRADVDAEEAVSPSLPQALREQLGLKIEKGKVKAEVIVVDSFEKVPTEN